MAKLTVRPEDDSLPVFKVVYNQAIRNLPNYRKRINKSKRTHHRKSKNENNSGKKDKLTVLLDHKPHKCSHRHKHNDKQNCLHKKED